MAEFLRGPFQGLAEALGIRGGKGAPGEIDLDTLSPVLVLNDLARFNSSRLWAISHTDVHVATGTIQSIVDPWGVTQDAPQLAGFELESTDHLEILAVGGFASESADFTRAHIQMQWPSSFEANVAQVNQTLEIFQSTSVTSPVTGFGGSLTQPMNRTARLPELPLPMQRGMRFVFTTQSDTAGTITINLEVLVRLLSPYWRNS